MIKVSMPSVYKNIADTELRKQQLESNVLKTEYSTTKASASSNAGILNTAHSDTFSKTSSTDPDTKKKKKLNKWVKIGLAAAVITGGILILKKSGALDKIINYIHGERLVDTNNKELFPFAKTHPLKAPGGILAEDGMVLTHITDYLPNDGYIDTTRSAVGGVRDSVHFAVNHGVAEHAIGNNWYGKPYAILTPMESTLNTPGNKFVGGIPADFYSKGRIKLPKDAVIVRYNDKIPQGKYKILNASGIKELRNLRGIKLIETSEKNMKTNVDNIVQKLGYELKDAPNAFYWGEPGSNLSFKELKRFSKFLQANDMIPAFHTYTPNGKTEMLIETIMSRSKLNLGWTFEKDGKLIADAKGDTLKLLDYIENYAKKTKYPLDFDIPKLKEIFSKSSTPKAALDEISKTMNIKSSINNDISKLEYLKELETIEQEIAFQSVKTQLIGGRGVSAIEKILNDYVLHPCQKIFSGLYDANEILLSEIDNTIEKFKPYI